MTYLSVLNWGCLLDNQVVIQKAGYVSLLSPCDMFSSEVCLGFCGFVDSGDSHEMKWLYKVKEV